MQTNCLFRIQSAARGRFNAFMPRANLRLKRKRKMRILPLLFTITITMIIIIRFA